MVDLEPHFHSANAGRFIPLSKSASPARQPPKQHGSKAVGESWEGGDGGAGALGAGLWAGAAGGGWTETWDSLSPRLRDALLPAVRSACATRLALVAEEGDAAALEAKGRGAALELALEGLRGVSLEDCWGLLGILDALCIVCSLAALPRAHCGEQWRWVSHLTALPCVAHASVRQAELGVNELTVRDKLGGSDLLRKALAVSLLARLCGALQERGPQTLTQLNILCKNISGVLQGLALNAALPPDDQDEEGASREEALRGMCAMAAVGSLCVVALRWVPSQGQARDPSFVLLAFKMLFSVVHAPAATESGMWCRWTAAHGLSELLALPALWRTLSKKPQAELLRLVLVALESDDLDDTCRVFAVRMLDSSVAYSVVVNLPNYLSQLLSRLLGLLRPIEADAGVGKVAPLLEMRWAALTLISRFLTEYLEDPDGGELDFAKYVNDRWFGACATEQQVTALRGDIRKAFSAYCLLHSLPPADVRVPA